MILISHRGNILGRIPNAENRIEYIQSTIISGYEVEVDVWAKEDRIWLGHDEPQYEVPKGWLEQMANRLWIHCKNLQAMEWFNDAKQFNYFWHENDAITLTSKGFIWAHPGKQPIIGSIAVMPELYGDDVSKCAGVCSDYVQNYKL